MFKLTTLTRVAAIGAVMALAACSSDKKLLGPTTPVGGDIFKSYVALGNSITAGYQSGGIVDSTQRQSYAFLLASRMGTQYHYASLAKPGCPAPIINFNTQARPTGAPPCALRSTSSITDILNNVAVPGASSYDPTAVNGTPFSNALTTFILGGKTQVQRALDAKPTFVSIGIIGNDYLSFAVQDGRTAALAGITPVATFTANYDKTIAQLLAGAPDVKGVIMANVLPTNPPIMFAAAAMSNPAFKTGFDAQAGTTTTLDPSCTAGGAGATSLINTFLAHQIRAGAHPPIVACVPGGASGTLPAPIGDILILDPTEQTTINTIVNGYNAYLQNKANSINFAYYDPNTLLTTLKAAGTVIRATPLYSSATAPFGTGMSLDGVHPALAVHRLLANDLIAVINTKYGTALTPVP
ncbi:MAG: SGNH/GDSL hydrolase family protein [Gemmatimonadota bacterium]|nr:SGNH/GDSL hydrolase family protein [Gemmatimonadota bacterium]